MDKHFLLYGLPRSGTNYVENLLKENFSGIDFHNEHYPECLPTHKHFRLYDEKHLVPGVQYLNLFFYPHFIDFDRHVTELTQQNDLKFAVVVKNPYAWYASYYRYAHKRMPWKRRVIAFLRNEANAHFILEWNLFYKKWLQFEQESPTRVKLVRYEDCLQRFDESMLNLQAHFNIPPKNNAWTNPSKVSMSHDFDEQRKKYYTSQGFVKDIPPLHFRAVTELLDKDVMQKLTYEWLPSEHERHSKK